MTARLSKRSERGANARTARAPQRPRAAELGVLHGHLGYFLRRAQVTVFQDFIRTLSVIGVGPAQYSVLVVIGANHGPSQSDISQLLGIERARLVRLLDGLEERGLTERLPSTTDQRSHAIHLTPEGQRLLARAKALAATHEERLMAQLGAERHKLLLDALNGFA